MAGMSTHEFETVLAKIGISTRDNRALSAMGIWSFGNRAPVVDLKGFVLGQMTEFSVIGSKIHVRGVMAYYGLAVELETGVRKLNPAWLDMEHWTDHLTGTMFFTRGTLVSALLVPAKDWAWA
jgi:hypothetical protein